MTKSEMEQILRENGWTDLWHPDNWVKKEWFNDPDINIDMAGAPMEQAYEMMTQEKSCT